MSRAWPGSSRAAAQLGEQRFDADPQLQRRLAVAAGVEVGAGAQQQRLAGVEPLAAAEHRGDPLLRAQLLLAPPPGEPPPAAESTSRASLKRPSATCSPLP